MARHDDPSNAEIREAIELVHLHHDVLQGPAGEIGLVAIVKNNNKALYDEKDGLMTWKKEVETIIVKGKTVSWTISVIGAGIGTLIGTLVMWWLTYRTGK